MYAHLVVNFRTGATADVKVDRSTEWGNPFVMKHESERPQVVADYAMWLLNQGVGAPSLDEVRARLKGLRLGCWCAPLQCHAHVLACIANEVDGEERVIRWLQSQGRWDVACGDECGCPACEQDRRELDAENEREDRAAAEADDSAFRYRESW